MTSAWTIYESPLGPLTLVAGEAGLRRLLFPHDHAPHDVANRDPEALAAIAAQLEQYFAGERRTFDIELDISGTPFQRAVWDQLLTIPYGSTRSYGELARTIGRPDRARAVGAAVGATPVPIIVPCHRMIGADGSLTGYGGGLPRKRALLDLEASMATGQQCLLQPWSTSQGASATSAAPSA
ncbi:MAG TPA: methylated-DNA--[protein]-cysteine S-methyltransferase [Solirubrobacteraceae bacterium]|jgi:methylated-DNA-[protein]-cysteine S-methyltransferase|nr:methylated-DNA--[protein]-cysteine S-methyltransferase [Solirubrobacteraceae bacterium]